MDAEVKQSKSRKITSRLAYSFGAFGHDAFYATLSTYFIMFVTSHLFDKSSGAQGTKMIAYITMIIAALRFVELAIDPLIGNAIDNTNSRWGHFKPWIVTGGTIGSVVLALLFTSLGGLNTSNPILYLIVFAILYITMDIFYSFKDVGFWSMIPAISFDSAEREKTATYARVGSNIGQNIVGVVVMPIVLMFSTKANSGQGDNRGWMAFGIIIAAVALISALAVAMGTKENDSELRKNTEKTTFKQVFKVLARNDQLMWLSLTYGIYTAGMAITNSLELYYFTYILGDASKFTLLGSLNAIIGVFAVLAFPPLAKKFSRRKVFFLAISVMIIALIMFALAGQSLPMILTSAVLFYIPQPLIFLVVLMVLSDSVEYGQLKFGHRDESLTLSVRPLLDKLGGAISNGVVGLTAVWAGMTAGATAGDVTSHGQAIFKLMMFGVPAAMILIGAFIFFKKVKLDEKMHAEIVDELEKTWSTHLETDETPAEIEKEDGITTLYRNPVSGKLISLDTVADETFASGSMGKGFAIKPTDGQVLAPFDGEVVATFPTRHAIGLRSDTGVLTLIHIGIGTVEMRGTGFVQYVEKGDHVKQGQELIEFWQPAIKKAGLDDTVMVVITNKDMPEFDYLKELGEDVKDSEDVLKLSNTLPN
ncbi:PTS sugar transporter subunit IIA [Pediococcus pentosaceus]|jgi:lactose/raffinose/galactose permease|uniref:PTS sugar transporter subunit IIA n=1 Tax=Pediococcus pentosaceus TaxID=1255 RepID=UPI000258B09A|nr:PTS sugar transporter subunit IIA [Pediococcus pentosaceus]ANI96977.1 PTS sugar transporter subunit IIA [Pediococcus pentosaceus]ASC09133.1 Lactose permease [Pediococcus pentosaceus]KQB82546.1 PTS sugar transporter subunit IIA [Pediococcus pentosaceus]KRN48047.1 Na+ xyloside symporter related transporter [Pediococcus pentosaceus]MBF7113904.1 PTS sugar transporter subunit IIA [Pediococcus pentosaceus]